LKKTVGMMKCMVTYFNNSMKTLKESSGDQKKSWALVQTKTKDEYVDLTQMKFIPPKQDDAVMEKIFTDKKSKIEEKFKNVFS